MKPTNQVILESLGAAQTVTGSKHLLKTPDLNILIDCGLFQGLKELRLKNWEKLPIPPSEVDVLLLTHAHLDHTGYIPLFVKNGFKGDIWMTPPTLELAKLIILDSAKIQEEDAEKANRFKYSKHETALPLYTIKDAEACFARFKTLDHSTIHKLSPNIQFQYHKNGHILGSCYIDMDCYGKKIIFSGDIGRYNSQFLASPAHDGDADFVIMESTYGDKLHGDTDPKVQLAESISDTNQQHGNVLIPCFAVGRAQELLMMLDELKHENKIPFNIPTYLDSPMAADVTDLLKRYPDWHLIKQEECQNIFRDITINRDFHNTEGIIHDQHSKIVLSASGMLTGGRVLEYMTAYAPDHKNLVLLIGYQADGTRGRSLKNGAHELKIHGKYVQVNARVSEITGLSAHADQKDLLRWVSEFKKQPQKVFLVHGEPTPQAALQLKIKDQLKIETIILKQDVGVTLFNI
jgi:metallo-beta-lactamase family protein